MKLARLVILAVALIAGGLAAYLAMNLSPGPTPVADAPPAPIATADVLVASKDIPLGTKVDASTLSWQAWPKSGTSSNYITKDSRPNAPTELAGTIAKGTFFAGEPITDAKLVHTDRGYMSAILPAGKRAIATSITADTSAGGFILPNDRVDVIMTRKIAGTDGEPDKFSTETVLNNIRVLAIDQTVEDKNGEKVVVGQTATLELSPQQAEILTVAQRMGDKLTLALRSLADAQTTPADTNNDALHLIGGTDRKEGVTVIKDGVAREISVNQ